MNEPTSIPYSEKAQKEFNNIFFAWKIMNGWSTNKFNGFK